MRKSRESTSPRIALVIPWFGKDLKGGAEQQAFQIAQRLSKRGVDVEVITTCSRSFHVSWHENYYRPGLNEEEGIAVRRFLVDNRNTQRFNQVVAKLLATPQSWLIPGIAPASPADEAAYWDENINSTDLVNYLKHNRDEYRCFIFLPYLFSITRRGIEAVGDKAYLQPCLHDECYAYLHATARLFSICGKILFNSYGESILAQHIYGEWIKDKSAIVGEGVELSLLGDEPKEPLPITEPYVLYVGKRCLEKNTHLLIEAFERYHQEHKSNLKLVLAGSSPLPVSSKCPHIIDLGVVSNGLKETLMQHCQALLNPSVNESFSRVIFEAWYAGRPIAVHAACLATYYALEQSDGAGWSAGSVSEWASLFHKIATTPTNEIAAMGSKGRVYAEATCDWDAAITRYLTLFEQAPPALATNQRTFIVSSSPRLKRAQMMELELVSRFLQEAGHQIVIIAKHKAALQAHPQLGAFLATATLLPQAATASDANLVWLGDENWPEADQFLAAFKGRRWERRDLAGAYKGQTLTSAPPAMIDLEHVAGGTLHINEFVACNGTAANILLLCDVQDPTAQRQLDAVMEAFHRRYQHSPHVWVLQAAEQALPASWLKPKTTYTVSAYPYADDCHSPLNISAIKVCDLLLALGAPCLPTHLGVVAQYYSLPALGIDAEAWRPMLGDDFLNFAPTEHASIAAAMKLILPGGDLRQDYISCGHANIKRFMHGVQKSHLLAGLGMVDERV